METNHRQIIILRGVPGSGKSTYAKKLVDNGWNRIGKDELRYMLNNYSMNNADEHTIHTIQYQILQTLIFNGRNIVIDNTHARDEYVHDLKVDIKKFTTGLIYDYEVIVKIIDTPLEECIRRNSLRENPVPEKVIRKMHTSLFS